MDIPISKLLQKMEAELIKAKMSQSDKERRERIVVIQSLCELILDEKAPVLSVSSPSPSTVNPAELQKMMGNMSTVVKSPSTTSKLKEDDGNGDSLFDF